MVGWRIHHKAETVSTNLDAREGVHGDVFTADYQTAGRGRLDHVWESPRGQDLLMSVVLSVEGLAPEHVSTLPLVAGLAVCKAVAPLIPHPSSLIPLLKWPNDVFIGGQKVAGILCERNDDRVIVGIGVNVGQTKYRSVGGRVGEVRTRVLQRLSDCYQDWHERGFAAVYSEIAAVDFLKGREIAVRQTDDDSEPIAGISNGIMSDGSLDVAGRKVYAGEAHVEKL